MGEGFPGTDWVWGHRDNDILLELELYNVASMFCLFVLGKK